MTEPRSILITGASRGIGRALVEHYLGLGDRVFGCARGEQTLEAEAFTYVRADVTREDDVKQLFREMRKHTTRLDALINNAGTARMLPLALTPAETARKIVDVNLLGTFLLTHGAIRLLRKAEAPRIVNLSTVAVPWRLEGESLYAAAKSAVETLTRVAAKELGGLGYHLQRGRALPDSHRSHPQGARRQAPGFGRAPIHPAVGRDSRRHQRGRLLS